MVCACLRRRSACALRRRVAAGCLMGSHDEFHDKCDNCNHVQDDWDDHCHHCGAAFGDELDYSSLDDRICPSCDTGVDPDDGQCFNCGLRWDASMDGEQPDVENEDPEPLDYDDHDGECVECGESDGGLNDYGVCDDCAEY